jgi:hypothetical protein
MIFAKPVQPTHRELKVVAPENGFFNVLIVKGKRGCGRRHIRKKTVTKKMLTLIG